MSEKKSVTTRVRCAVSGLITGCRPDVFAKRVAKAGSEEAMLATCAHVIESTFSLSSGTLSA